MISGGERSEQMSVQSKAMCDWFAERAAHCISMGGQAGRYLFRCDLYLLARIPSSGGDNGLVGHTCYLARMAISAGIVSQSSPLTRKNMNPQKPSLLIQVFKLICSRDDTLSFSKIHLIPQKGIVSDMLPLVGEIHNTPAMILLLTSHIESAQS